MPIKACERHEILVVDDDPFALSAIVRVIQAMGYVVASAFNGADALRLLSVRDFDLVITDVHMPEMDGVELLRVMKTRYPRVPAIAMSGEGALSSEVALDAARLLGSAGGFDKSIDKKALRRLIQDVLVGDGA